MLAAPNAFKGSLTAVSAARAVRAGVLSVFPRAEVSLLPISDGGDGLMDCLLFARPGKKITVGVAGPLGERRRASFAIMRDGKAVVEMARASGLAIASRLDPLWATSYGTGQLIKAAIDRGARTILVGMGGSASNDGGAGMAQALGARLLDSHGLELGRGARELLNLSRIETGSMKVLLKGVRVIGVTDVVNPLTGPRGSARVYGPQKGATPRTVEILERALSRYARVIKRDLGKDVARVPGAGAAGGLGAGLLAFLNAELVPGADWVFKELGGPAALSNADAAITGEGKMDKTSFYGKAPVAFARRAKARGVPVAAICAGLDAGILPRLKREGIAAVATLAGAGASPENSMSLAPRWVAKAAASAIRQLSLAVFLCGACLAAPAFDEIDRLYFHRNEGKNLEESIRLLEDVLKAEPGDAGAHWRLGRSLVRLGERQDSKKEKLKYYLLAEEKIRKSIELKPDEADSHFWLGLAMGRRGETKGILNSLFLIGPLRQEMATAIKLDPKHGGAHHVLGEILRQLPRFAGGSKKEAVKEMEEAVRLSPDYTANYPSLAEAYVSIGEKEKAIATLKKIFEVKDPADPAEFESDLKDARELLQKLEK